MAFTLHEKLDRLKESLPYSKELTFKFTDHDYQVIDWFIDGGHVRSYTDKKYFPIFLVKGDVQLYIGVVSPNQIFHSKNEWVKKYIKHFWNKNQNVEYCTSNLLKTISEIQSNPRVVSFTDETITYYDGSVGNIFHLSKDNKKSITKNIDKLITILNEL